MRMSRRMGIHNAGGAKKPKDLKELFSNMTVVGGASRASSSAGTCTLSVTRTTEPRYVFGTMRDILVINKLVNGTLTLLKEIPSAAVGQSSVNVTIKTSNLSSTLTSIRGYGASILVVSFPSEFDEAQIDALLSGITLHAQKGLSASSGSSVSLLSSSFDGGSFAFACLCSSSGVPGVSISCRDNWSDPIFTTDGYVHLFYKEEYWYLSDIGTRTASTRGGTIIVFN